MQLFGAINSAMFDWPWSGIHFLSGTLIGLIVTWWSLTRPTRRFWCLGVGLLVVWEIYEWSVRYLDIHHHQAIAGYKATVMGFAFAPETTINTFGDLVIGTVGLLVGRWVIMAIRRRLTA